MKLRHSLVVLALWLVPAAARAQDPDPPTCPDSVVTQFDMHVCANEQYLQRRTLLDQVIREIHVALAPGDGLLDRGLLLDSAQTVWAAYVTAHCEFVASEFDGGSLEPTAALVCLTDETERRIRELARWLCTVDADTASCPAADQYLTAIESGE